MRVKGNELLVERQQWFPRPRRTQSLTSLNTFFKFFSEFKKIPAVWRESSKITVREEKTYEQETKYSKILEIT